MKLLKHTLILNFLIFLIIMALGILGYLGYQTYKGTNAPSESSEIPVIIEEISNTLVKLDLERINTSAYLSTHTRSNYYHMLESRKTVDVALYRLHNTIRSSSIVPTTSSSEVKMLFRTLKNIRDMAEVRHPDMLAILYKGYHNTVFKTIDQLVIDLALEQSNSLLEQYIRIYHEIIDFKENSVLESTIVYSILLQQRPISTEEKEILEQTIAKDRFPQFSLLQDDITAVDLRTLLSENDYLAIVSNERQKLFQGSQNGIYQIDIISWLGKYEEKLRYFHDLETILQKRIKEKVQEQGVKIQTRFIGIGIITFILFYLLYKLLRLRKESPKRREASKETLKDIELVFTPQQRKKLKHLMEEGNVDLVYKFMIQAISDANRTKDLFLASMSHEIRTPLNGILGFTQLLKETDMTEEQEDFVSVIEKSSDHLLSIVNDILDLSKIKAEKLELEIIPFDPLEKFETAVETYAGKAYKEHIDLNVFIDPHLPTKILGDPTKISQVIVNLLSNAVKFTPENGEINVRIEVFSQTNESITVGFSVEDTGIGISSEQRKKIFQAFSQADVSTSRKYGGTGLGLSISGKLVELMGGELGIRSVPGEGSTFHFTLVLSKPADAQQREENIMKGLKVGILDPQIDQKYFINHNLEAYLNYLGTEKIEHFTESELIEAKEKKILPDILFIDHKFRQRDGNLDNYLNLGCRIVLLSTGDQKKSLKKYGSKIDKILYKPITFTKTLKAVSQREEEKEEHTQFIFENIHLLVAEDNPINQKLITNILNKTGIEVDIANNGAEAVESYMKNQYDIIFMDIEMPVMGGMEATAKIRSYEREKGIRPVPIVALTANALSGDKAKYLGAGMDDYMAKPIKLDELRRIFTTYFEERTAEAKAS